MSYERIIYEQPLNELVRINLKLEGLFLQFNKLFNSSDFYNFLPEIVRILMDILFLLNRADLKSKFSTELQRHINNLARFKNSPNIEYSELTETIQQLKEHLNHFVQLPGKIAQELRQNELLNVLSINLLNPATGSTCVEMPFYYHWLNQPPEQCKSDIASWAKALKEVKSTVALLLKIVRECACKKPISIINGFYHETLDPQLSCQMIRLFIDKNNQVYPEISAGKHRFSVRLMVPSSKERAIQAKDSIKAEVMVCIV